MSKKRRRSRDGSDGSVSRRTVVGAALLGGAGLLGLRETGAFSAGTGDRPFSVGTAGDDTAFLGSRPAIRSGTNSLFREPTARPLPS